VTADHGAPQERSLGQLFGDLTGDMSELFRKEVELARVEVKQEVGRAGKAALPAAGAAGAAVLAVLMLSFALAWGLAAIMPTGFAFLLVAVLYGIAAAVLFPMAKNRLQALSPVPEQTIDTLKEDVQWAKNQIK